MIDLALPGGEAAADRAAAGQPRPLQRDLRVVGPQHLAGGGVVGRGDVPGGDVVEHAVDLQRRGLHTAIGVEVRKPGEAQPTDVRVVDLLERAEALLGPVPTSGHPLPGILVRGAETRLIHVRQGAASSGAAAVPWACAPVAEHTMATTSMRRSTEFIFIVPPIPGSSPNTDISRTPWPILRRNADLLFSFAVTDVAEPGVDRRDFIRRLPAATVAAALARWAGAAEALAGPRRPLRLWPSCRWPRACRWSRAAAAM